jgi:hypothetical protein
MTDDRFEDLMRDAAHTYRRPPEPPMDAMWKAIEAAHFGRTLERWSGGTRAPAPWSRRGARWLGIAATLVIGIALGRWSMSIGRGRAGGSTSPSQAAAVVAPAVAVAGVRSSADSGLAAPYEVETSRYLGQTAALLIALPSEARAGRPDEQFVNRADELLTRTRLLLDSPAASDAQMRSLLEDLEVVLAQVVRLQNNHSRTELDLINQALEQRDVIPRLRTAVADISAN